MLCFFVFFFFSSRRRHTRCGRDWSSDVCSSDLIAQLSLSKCNWGSAMVRSGSSADWLWERLMSLRMARDRSRSCTSAPYSQLRSEERRVGKECRCRWAAEHEKREERKVKEGALV